MASISVRDSIRWLPDSASEPTSTLVLTSPEKRFVDIRVLRSASNESPTDESKDELPLSLVDWAFAGYSRSESRNGIRHSWWRHFVDSRSKEADGIVDEGDMVARGDGRTLETGRMVNPATGRETDYEEVWTDVEPSSSTVGQEAKARCAVLELRCDERDERGMVVRLGRYCQGVVRKGDEFTLERWQWTGGEWVRQYWMGSLWIPCAEAIEGAGLTLGGELKHQEQIWNVVEISDL